MIVEGRLTYRSVDLSWLRWEFQNFAVNDFAVAAVTTILSYQTASLLFDIFLGVKRKNVTKARDIHTLLLLRKASPLAVCNNLLRKDWLTRIYYGRDLPKDTTIARDKHHIKNKVAIRLLFLLLVPPFINIVSVMSTLWSEQKLTFADAGFQGVALGVNKNLSLVETEMMTGFCDKVPIYVARGDKPLVDFSLCALRPIISTRNFKFGYGTVGIGVKSSSFVVVWIGLNQRLVYGTKTASMLDDQSLYRLKPDLMPESAAVFVEHGMELVAAACGLPDSSSASELSDDSTNALEQSETWKDVEVVKAKYIRCPVAGDTEKDALRLLRTMEKFITLVNSEKLDVVSAISVNPDVDPDASIRFDGENHDFLVRRQRNIGFSVLALMTSLFLLLRTTLLRLCNNDVSIGLERVMKERLGFPCCQSMLTRGSHSMSYNNKYQSGKAAQYGLHRTDMLEVGKFDGGIIGGEVNTDGVEGSLFCRAFEDSCASCSTATKDTSIEA